MNTTRCPLASSRFTSTQRAFARARSTRSRRANETGRRGRPTGSGTRRVDALAIVRDKPGVTIREIAEKMGIKQTYLYRVLPALAQDGLVRKDGRGWHPHNAT